MVFDMAMLNRGGIVPTLHFNKPRLLPGGLIVTLADIGMSQDIVGILLMDLGRPILHGLLHIQHKRKLFVRYLQRPNGLGRSHLVFRDDHRHLIAVVADMAV